MGTRDKMRLCCHQSTTTVGESALLAELLTQTSKESRGEVGLFLGCASAQRVLRSHRTLITSAEMQEPSTSDTAHGS